MSSLLLPTDEAPSAAAAGRRRGWAAWAPAGVAAAALLLTWLGSGVGASAIGRYVAFEALWVLLPGCLACILLSPTAGGRLRTLAIGWPLGYAMEVGAFALTAALHTRWALTLLPLVSLVLGGLILARAPARARLRALLAWRGGGGRAAGPRLLVALSVSVATVLLAFTFFAASPLPERARSVSYSEDNVFDITLAGEARHHWPITESWIAGEPLHYYTGVFQHAAALNQVMGISLAVSFLRLLPSTMFLIAALQLWALGAGLARRRRAWVGALSAALLLVTQDVNLNPLKTLVLQINPFTQFPLSPSFAFGVPFFLGGLLLLQAHVVEPSQPVEQALRVEQPRPVEQPREVEPSPRVGAPAHTRARESLGLLAMVAVLVAGAGAAKAFGAFDLVGGLGLYWLWQLARGRASRTLTCCVLVAGASVLAIYFLMIAGGGAATMGVHPLAFLSEGNTLERATRVAKQVAGPSLYWLVLGAGAGALAVCALAPLLGAGWLLWRERGLSERSRLLVSVFAVGLAGYVTLGAPGGVEGVFFVYGYIALLPLAALGLVELWAQTPAAARSALARVSLGLLALGVVIAAVSASVTLSGLAQKAWLVLAYGSVAGTMALVVWRLQGHWTTSLPSRWARMAACCIPLLTALALVKPVALAGDGAWKTLLGRRTSLADTNAEYGITAPLYAGLLWVRAHTNACDVLAVNNHYDNAAHAESVYFYYSAFTERRVFLESWRYTAGGQTGGLPYPGRLALNQRAVAQANPRALSELARAGVSYVLVDRTHTGGPLEPASASTLVFANSALDVYRLAGARPKC